MSTIVDRSARRFVCFQLVGLCLAAVGWEIWLDVYYRNSIVVKGFWVLAPILAVILAQKRPLVRIAFDPASGLVLAGAGIFAGALLGLPFSLPAGIFVAGILILLLNRSERSNAVGGSLVFFAVFLGLQAAMVCAMLRLVACTSTIEWVSPPVAALLRFIGVNAGTNAGQVVAPNAHFAWRFAPSLSTLGMLWVIPLAVSGAGLLWRLRGIRAALLFLAATMLVFPIFRYILIVVLYLRWETMDWFFCPTLNGILAVCVALPASNAEPRSAFAQGGCFDFSMALQPARLHMRLPKVGLVTAGIYLVLLGLLLPDPGRQKAGRVLVDEAHGGWEWTTESFETDWYGQAATYNYWCMFDYISAHYPVVRNYQALSAKVLEDADILVIKTPSKLFSPGEIDAVRSWVSKGGGLYLIGDHTNVFGMTTCLQPLATEFGIGFGYDSTHELETGELQRDDIPSRLRHPVLSGMPPKLLWGTSCSLTSSPLCQPILAGKHIRSRYLDYGRRGFFATSYLLPNERYGPILQCVGTRYGRGRVVAFSDSTIFSNFWTFFPGKSELYLGTLKWLNHSNTPGQASWLTILTGLLCFALTRVFAWGRKTGAGALLLGLLIGVPAAVHTRDAFARAWYGLPSAKGQVRTLVFEKEYSFATMPDFAMQGKMEDSYQTFYTWVQRLGVVPKCVYSLEESAAPGYDRIVMIRPQRPLSGGDLRCLDRFFQRGGKLLVIDGAGNPQSSVNLLLQEYGLSVDFRHVPGGLLQAVDAPPTPQVSIPFVCRVEGGDALALAGNVPVLSVAGVREGEIWACSLADVWSDASLGTSNADATAQQRLLSELEYWTLKLFMTTESGE
ncbi:MAG: hypothetical protein JSU94_00705 [Phycisphaerales bacterium]|nr:MAG: hypothetical protein JSU94_00705 [Phycisphaerales bacterium]